MAKSKLIFLLLPIAAGFAWGCNKEVRPVVYLPKVTEAEMVQEVGEFNEKWIAKESRENVKNITLWLLNVETRNILQRKRIKYLEDLLKYEPEKKGEVIIEKKSVTEIDEEYKKEK